MAEEMQKVYCCDRPNDSYLLAELMNAKNQGTDAATMSALFANRDNGWNNNPFAYLIWLMAMRWMGNWGQDGNGENYNSRQIAQLQGTVNDNHNNDLAMQAIAGNTNAIRELATNLNVPLNAIQQGICSLNAGLQNLGGQIGMSSQQVINSVLLGNKDLQAQLMQCCCENKQLVTTMGYEGQLRDQANTAAINTNIEGTRQAVVNGFSNIGYAMAQQFCDLKTNENQNTQRIIDTLNSHWQLETSQRLQDEKFKNSQLEQNIYLGNLIKANGCGASCGC